MRKSKVLAKLRAGKVARIFSIGSPIGMIPTMASHYHYDGVWVDGEHRVWDPREVESMLARHYAADVDCIWRPPTKEKNALYRLIEDGATGLMIPHVSTPDQARSLVQAVKFPPLGDRGFDGAGRDADFWFGAPRDYVEQINRETFLVVQIETQEALGKVDAIAEVPGVEVLFIGPGDLSLRLGSSPGVQDPQMMEAQRRVAEAAAAHGKAWGRPVATSEDAQVLIDLGAQFLAMGSEFVGLTKQFAECSAEFDMLLEERNGETLLPAKTDNKAY